MATSVAQAERHLKRRAASLRQLPGKSAHPIVTERVARASRALEACAGMLPELAAAFRPYVQGKRLESAARIGVVQGKPEIQALQQALLMSMGSATASITVLIESADSIGRARDPAALKSLGAAAYGTVVKGVLVATGVEVLKTVADLASAASDMTGIGHAAKHRSEQAGHASEFLRWIDAVTSVAVVWLVGAEEFLGILQGKKKASSKVLRDRVSKRIG